MGRVACAGGAEIDKHEEIWPNIFSKHVLAFTELPAPRGCWILFWKFQ